MTALPARGVATDAELVGAAVGGDRQAFARIYDRYADRLYDFCVGMVRDRDTAADCVQDAFCTAATQLPRLRDPDKLRPWLYAIVRNEALRHIRQRSREQVFDDFPEMPSADAGPDTLVGRNQLAALVAEAAGGLSDRDRSVLDLTYRHGLDGPELAGALGVSPANATKMVFRLRETVERSLGALLVARRAQQIADSCPELGQILANWDGQFSILMRKRIARHIESCATCDAERRRLVNPVALLGGAPVFICAPDWLRNQTLGQIKLTSAASRLSRGRTGSTAAKNATGAGNTLRRAALYGGGLVAAVGAAMLWLYHSDIPVDPTQGTPPPSTAAPASAPPQTTAAPPGEVPAPVTTGQPSYRPPSEYPPASTAQTPGPTGESAPPSTTQQRAPQPSTTEQLAPQPSTTQQPAPPVSSSQVQQPRLTSPAAPPAMSSPVPRVVPSTGGQIMVPSEQQGVPSAPQGVPSAPQPSAPQVPTQAPPVVVR